MDFKICKTDKGKKSLAHNGCVYRIDRGADSTDSSGFENNPLVRRKKRPFVKNSTF